MPGEFSRRDTSRVLIPLAAGVAFDPSLSRLGHGKGYYDRFITAYTASHGAQKPLLGIFYGIISWLQLTATLVALALREQILEPGAVPMTDHDWKMDAVVGPDEILGEELSGIL